MVFGFIRNILIAIAVIFVIVIAISCCVFLCIACAYGASCYNVFQGRSQQARITELQQDIKNQQRLAQRRAELESLV